jgi:serine/threonine protein phosphatase 1
LNRPQWLCSKSLAAAEVPADCPYTVVSGHGSVPAVQFGHKRILADTTGGTGGELSCLLLPEKKVLCSGAETALAEDRAWWKIW